MDPRSFDSLARSLAAPQSRRGLLGTIAALGAGLLGRRGADAQVTQVYCGNTACASNPGVCKPGCVCCTYTNSVTGTVINSRCRPPGSCGPSGATVCPVGLTYCPSLGRCSACCTDADCGGVSQDCSSAGLCVNGVCEHQQLACGTNEICEPGVGCVCSGSACGNGSCCPAGTTCCSFGANCQDGCCAGEVAPSGFCCLGEVNSEGVCCEGNIACGEWCCDADTQECNEDSGHCVTVRACPVGFEEVNQACFRIVPSLDYCRGRVQEVCGSACTNCIGSVDGSSNYLCAKKSDTICPSGSNDQCLPFHSACHASGDPFFCYEKC